MQWITVGEGRGLPADGRAGGFWLKLSGDLDSSQNPNEIQGLPSICSSLAHSRDEDKYRAFSVHDGCWGVTVSFSLFLATS